MKIKFKLLLILSLSVWVQASNDIKELESDKNYVKMNKFFSKVIAQESQSDKWLLRPTDIINTLKVINGYRETYKTFTEERKEFMITNNNTELYRLYLNTFKRISNVKLISDYQFVARNDFEIRLLKLLKKDKGIFSDLEKKNLISKLENLLLIKKISIYEIQKNINIFYANNIKKYLSKVREIPLYLINTTNDEYQNFIYALNKGEALILEGLKLDDFTNFKKFVDELEVSESEVQNLLEIKDSNPLEFSKQYGRLWIRGQVFGRYLLSDLDLIRSQLRRIEKEKEFFETL